MFSTLFGANPMDLKAGEHYREIILEKGGIRDEMELLHELLGRAPNADAFTQTLGLRKPE